MSLKIEISNFEKNSMQEFEESGKKILIVNAEGNYYALDGKCTHRGCKLSKGKLEGKTIICPCHGSQFNAADGKIVKWTPDLGKFLSSLTKFFGLAKNLKSYKVVIEKDNLIVEIE